MAASNERAAARKGRTRAATKKVDPAPDVEVVMDGAPQNGPPQEMPDGILVIKTATEQGGIQVNLQTVGNAQVTEIPFLLEMGLKVFRQEIGFDERK